MENRFSVDYYDGDDSLNYLYLFIVDDTHLGVNEQVVDTRWFSQTQVLWYPGMREKLCLAIKKFAPDFLFVNVSMLESW